MRRLAQGIVGALALGFMLIAQPWELRDCQQPECTYGSSGNSWYWLVFGTMFEVGIIAVIVTIVLIGVLGIRDAGRASETAVYAALGRTQRSAAAIAARRGAVDGALVAGAAFVLAGIVHVWLVLSSGYQLFEQESGLWLVRATGGAVFVCALTAAHVIDAVRPRRTPVERLHEDAAPPSPRRVSLRTRTAAVLVPAAVCGGLIVGIALAHDPSNGAAGTFARVATQTALVALALLGIALFFLVGVPLIRAGIAPAMGGVARAAGALKATRTSALLQARAATSSSASSRTVLAIGGLAFLTGALCMQDPSPSLAPEYVGTVTIQPADAGAAFADEYAAIPGVATVLLGSGQFGDWPTAVALDPAMARDVDPTLYDLMTRHPDAIITGNGVGQGTLNELAAQGVHVTGAVQITTCCTAFTAPANVVGEPGWAALVIYAEPGADMRAVTEAVETYTPTTDLALSIGSSMAHYYGESSSLSGTLFTVTLIVLVCGGPIVALAVGIAARRRRDDATLGALGATRKTLAGVAVLETTAIAALAVGAGLLAGAALQTMLSLFGAARASLWGLITDSYLDVALHSVAWGPLLTIWAGAVATFALVAWVVSRLGAAQLPAETLRAVEAGGVR